MKADIWQFVRRTDNFCYLITKRLLLGVPLSFTQWEKEKKRKEINFKRSEKEKKKILENERKIKFSHTE